jgi:hypothetical protein
VRSNDHEHALGLRFRRPRFRDPGHLDGESISQAFGTHQQAVGRCQGQCVLHLGHGRCIGYFRRVSERAKGLSNRYGLVNAKSLDKPRNDDASKFGDRRRDKQWSCRKSGKLGFDMALEAGVYLLEDPGALRQHRECFAHTNLGLVSLDLPRLSGNCNDIAS